MDDDRLTEALFTRRRFLRVTAGGLAAAGVAPILAACGGGDGGEAAAPPPAEPSEPAAPPASTGAAEPAAPPAIDGGGETLKMWWWGEPEAIGIQKWVDETIAKFKDEANYVIDPLLMDTSQVIPQFTNAAAAGKPPDIQFVFNGIYHMENVWLGYIQPLNGLLPDDVLTQSGATALSIYQGQQYRVGFYIVGFGIEYNKELFDKAGLDADSPPTTWDAFLDTCDKLKTSGVIPLGGGIKDGFFGEWYFVNTLTQNLNSPADALNLFIGELDWREPQYHEHWVKLQELHDNGFINDDINSLQLYQGTGLVDTSKAAMTINTTAALPAAQETLGADNVGYMIFPTFGTGSMAGIPITDTQGFCIPTDAKDAQGAAAFLEFMHSEERVNAMWTTSRALPADEKFDSSLIDDPFLKTVYETWWAGDHNVYVADLMPTLFWTDAMFVISQDILGGKLKGSESGEIAAQVTEKWKKQNPDLVENYTAWGQDLAAA
jgi:raffinose/stachyose/melibiose transport system substrate-binding protein